MAGIRTLLVLGLVVAFGISAPADLPIKLEVRTVLDSRSANIHFSQRDDSVYPFSVTYGACGSSGVVYEKHHDISTVHAQGTDRLIWLLPDDIKSSGCLSAWSSTDELVGRSEPLVINKESRRWRKKRHLDSGTRLSKRASIPMTNSSGVDAIGPWFDGVAALEDVQIGAVDAAQAKAKKIAIVGAGMAGLMTWLCLNASGFQNLEIIEAGQRLGGRVQTAYLEGGPSDYQYQEMGPMRFPETIRYAGTNETLPVNDMQLVFQLADMMNQLNQGKTNYTVNFIPWIQTSPNGLYYFNGYKQANGLPPTVTEIKENPSLTGQTPEDPQVANITDLIFGIGCNPNTSAAVAKNVFTAFKAFVENGLNGLGGDDWSEFAYLHNYLGYSLNATDQAVNTGGARGGNSLWELMSVALQFSTRFWEHLANPILGGCSTTTDIPGIGSICYPSYKINSTGPGVMLASYTNSDFGIRFSSLPELEHVQYVLNAMVEIHGEVAREQYTGRYNRKCWALDPLESASWASPSVVPSALESGIRGSVQLLLELGLIDEAKAITEKFMARWISI
ncbi:MAG: hypothetical protein Q9208_000588 [Pyrenodesmia sp. 3 TL-2023]